MAVDDSADLPFDPVRVRLKIHVLRKNLDGLTALMESYGLPVDPPRNGSRSPSEKRLPIRARVTRTTRRRRTAKTPPRTARRPKLADLGVEVITRHGGQAHGKVIVQELRRMGHLQNVAHPDSNISTALSRDPRVRRVENVRNTWALIEKASK